MPATLHVCTGLRAYHSEYFGEVSLTDVLGQREEIQMLPDFDPSYALIVDLTAATGMSMHYEQVQIIAKSPAPLARDSRFIFVAPSDLAYGIVRMYQALGEDQHPNTVVVRSLGEALSLLPQTEAR